VAYGADAWKFDEQDMLICCRTRSGFNDCNFTGTLNHRKNSIFVGSRLLGGFRMGQAAAFPKTRPLKPLCRLMSKVSKNCTSPMMRKFTTAPIGRRPDKSEMSRRLCSESTDNPAITVGSVFLLYNIPTIVLLAIYFGCREKRRKTKALEKMRAQDLQ
jgi:hypothetical protein